VGLALVQRGHRVTYFGLPHVERDIRRRGIGFVPVAPAPYPPSPITRALTAAVARGDIESVLHDPELGEALLTLRLRELPRALHREGVEAIVADELSPEACTSAEELGVRFVSFASALPTHRDPAVPPCFTPWRPRPRAIGALRNRAGYALRDRAEPRVQRVINAHRRERGLAVLEGSELGLSPLLQLSQLPEELDFHYEQPPSCLRRVGPLLDHSLGDDGEWTDDLRNSKPLVYVSFGMLDEPARELCQRVLDALDGQPVQVCMSLGGVGVSEARLTMPASAIVLPRVAQRTALSRAAAFITAAHVSSALEALEAGVPMLAIPLAGDQPGMAARLSYHGAARLLLPRKASVEQIRKGLMSVLREARYRARALALGDALRATPGLPRAAQLIEDALRTGRLPSA
jgi:MGT family glycosyltransferase